MLLEFADYECPFCAKHTNDVQPKVISDLIRTGEVTYAYFHFPFQRIHRNAFNASVAAECAGAGGKFWEMHRLLFANQKDLLGPSLLTHAATLGLDMPSFRTCLATKAAAVSADIKHGETLGVRSTPTFFIGEQLPDGQIHLRKRITGTVGIEGFKAALKPDPPVRRALLW